MASLSEAQLSLRVRKLAELLEEQQEPFLLDVYLLENGYSDSRLLSSPASNQCWPRKFAICRSLRRSSSLRSSAKTRPSGLLRSVLNLFQGISTSWKPFKLEDKASGSLEEERRCVEMDVEEESQQLGPVSFLQLHSRQDLEDEDNKLTFDSELQTKALDIFKELLQLAYIPVFNELNTSKFNLDQPDKLVPESERNKPENNLDSLDRSNIYKIPDHVKKEDQVISYSEMPDRDFYSINQMITPRLSDLSWRDWKDYNPEFTEIGLQIEAAIFEDIREEAVMEMIVNPPSI